MLNLITYSRKSHYFMQQNFNNSITTVRKSLNFLNSSTRAQFNTRFINNRQFN